MEAIDLIILGVESKFYPKGNKYGHYFESFGMGYYVKDFFPTWGRPTKKNAKEVAEFYITSFEGRLKTFESNKKQLKNEKNL